MNFEVWLEYLIRFSHLVAGIAWIGSSFYFIWMDSSFEAPEKPRKNVEGELFMVHGGFYYQVEKRKIYPGELPKTLHWFKWEATLTWATGFVLLIVLYFLKGANLLIDPQVYAMTQAKAVGISLALLVGAWFLYDLIWHPVWMAKLKPLSAIVSLILLGAMVYGLTRVFSGRGAFILTGAILGSLMLLNVWIRILPGQRKMIREAEAGQIPDYSVSLKSKTRSVHNTYFIFPVLFIMLSNHYPALYMHPLNWALLLILALGGALTRHAMVTKNPIERWTVLPAALCLGALIYMTGSAKKSTAFESTDGPVEYARVSAIVQKHCLSCHSAHPTDEVWTQAPKGIHFEHEAVFRKYASLIQLHVVQAKSMPLGNKTQMNDEERAIIGRWLIQEKLID